MITIQDIISYSKPHPGGDNGRHTRLTNGLIEVSIVGGRNGLYGDFKETFEVAIFDSTNRQFKTKFFFPENGDDVFPYMESEELESFVNNIFKDGSFQVL
jgi:hypothetical protein